jgi:hypothetical protein
MPDTSISMSSSVNSSPEYALKVGDTPVTRDA